VPGHPQAGLFFQATSSTGTNAIVLPDANGMFSSAAPAQTWTDGYLGFKWSMQNANVYAGDFNGDGMADLLIQGKPNFVLIDFDPPFPVPVYPPNMNGVVLAQRGVPIFTATGLQAWSRMSNGVDWSSLHSRIVIATNASGRATVILQALHGGQSSYQLQGAASGGIFSAGATALGSNVSLSADSHRLITGDFTGSGTPGIFYQALTSGSPNYVSDSLSSSMTAASMTASTAPSGLRVTNITASQVSLSWTASTDNVAVTGYFLERCQGDACSNFAQMAAPTGTTYTDAGLTGSTSYSYRVSAGDAASNRSPYSGVVNVVTLIGSGTGTCHQ
jgi:hypothetical protein